MIKEVDHIPGTVCTSCGSDNDLLAMKISTSDAGGGQYLCLCKECRDKLLKLLKQYIIS